MCSKYILPHATPICFILHSGRRVTSLTSPHQNRKVLRNKHSNVTIEKCCRGQNLLPSFRLSLKTRESIDMLCKNELFPFCKNRQSQQYKATLTYERGNSETAANVKKKTLFTFPTPNDLNNNLIKYCTRAFELPCMLQHMNASHTKKPWYYYKPIMQYLSLHCRLINVLWAPSYSHTKADLCSWDTNIK
jgi:hypothetical protein